MKSIYTRRSFIKTIGIIGGALSLKTSAQQTTKRRRIGFLIGDAPKLIAAFEQEMSRLGYEPGKNIVIEKRVSRTNTADLAEQSAELAAMDLELIFAASLPQALAVRKANPKMPMVIATCPGMISNGFAKSLKRPGGIYTGMDELPPGITAKRLQLLKTIAPKVSRVALFSTTPGEGGHEMQLAEAEKTAQSLGIAVKVYRAKNLSEINAALDAVLEDRMDGLVNFQGGLSLANRQIIVDIMAKNRLPAIYQSEFFVESGGLMAWAPDQEKQFREAARYVDKILKGAKPANLPIRYPKTYYLTINKGAAEKLEINIPRSLVARAKRILI
jgi:putative tryptophan/tyrosine transport system substrate-binding protein